MAGLNERDAKLVQWLNEAHAKEAELEADLTAHIALTEKQSYKKRLQEHLKETRDHKRRVASRVKKLGGSATIGPSLPGVSNFGHPGPGGADLTLDRLRRPYPPLLRPKQAETHMRNAQQELREEHVEIAIYTRLEVFAGEVGDRDTAQLARGIRREEERMAKFLDSELRRLVKDVVKAEVPAKQRPSRRRSSRAGRATSPSRRRSGASRPASRGSSPRSRGSRRPRASSSS
jgi:ferritin-like metal-binding protein YciE